MSKTEQKVGLYFSNIVDNKSTARYQHPLAVVKNFNTYLISDRKIPAEIKEKAKKVFILDDISPYKRGFKALSIAKKVDFDVFITNMYYECLFSGFFSNTDWIIDFTDDPLMFRYNNKFYRLRGLFTYILPYLLNQADLGLHISHPSSPHSYGKKRVHIMDGALPLYGEAISNSERRIIWAGKPYLDRGMKILIKSLQNIEDNIKIDVYGEGYEKSEKFAEKLDVSEKLKFYGKIPHDEMLNKIEKADFGLCVLPERTDWVYSTPIKVGEYLSGATIPILSDFPGMRWQAKDTGIYVEPNAKALASKLKKVINFSNDEIISRKEKALNRASEIQWDDMMKEYIKEIESILAHNSER